MCEPRTCCRGLETGRRVRSTGAPSLTFVSIFLLSFLGAQIGCLPKGLGSGQNVPLYENYISDIHQINISTNTVYCRTSACVSCMRVATAGELGTQREQLGHKLQAALQNCSTCTARQLCSEPAPSRPISALIIEFPIFPCHWHCLQQRTAGEEVSACPSCHGTCCCEMVNGGILRTVC